MEYSWKYYFDWNRDKLVYPKKESANKFQIGKILKIKLYRKHKLVYTNYSDVCK